VFRDERGAAIVLSVAMPENMIVQKRKHTLVAGLFCSLVVFLGLVSFTAPAKAQMNCSIRMEVGKIGFVVGFSGGSGTLTCNGQNYPLDVGGMSAGLVIGGSRVSLVGEVRNLNRISDIEGTYTGVGASAAAGGGANNVVARNQNGVQLVMRGRQAGLEASLDLGGTRIKLKR
jgi:hypothetical protein